MHVERKYGEGRREQNARPARFPTSTRPKNVTEPLEHPPDDLRRENVRNLPPIVRAMAREPIRATTRGTVDANRRGAADSSFSTIASPFGVKTRPRPMESSVRVHERRVEVARWRVPPRVRASGVGSGAADRGSRRNKPTK